MTLQALNKANHHKGPASASRAFLGWTAGNRAELPVNSATQSSKPLSIVNRSFAKPTGIKTLTQTLSSSVSPLTNSLEIAKQDSRTVTVTSFATAPATIQTTRITKSLGVFAQFGQTITSLFTAIGNSVKAMFGFVSIKKAVHDAAARLSNVSQDLGATARAGWDTVQNAATLTTHPSTHSSQSPARTVFA